MHGNDARAAGLVRQPVEAISARKPAMSFGTKVKILQTALVAAFFGFWEGGVRAKFIDPFFFPAPSTILGQIIEWIKEGDIWYDVYITLLETVLSFIIGIVGGIVLGVWLALSPVAAAVLQPFLKIFNAIPRILLAPLFVIWFGLGLESKVALGVTMVLFQAFFNTYQGVREVNPVVIANARLLKASRTAMLRHVYLPSAASWIVSSLRMSVGLAVMGAVVSEYLGASAGLGYMIARAEGLLNATGVFAGIVFLAVFVIVLDIIVDRIEQRLLVWRAPQNSVNEPSEIY